MNHDNCLRRQSECQLSSIAIIAIVLLARGGSISHEMAKIIHNIQKLPYQLREGRRRLHFHLRDIIDVA